MISFLVTLLVFILIFGIVWYAVSQIPLPPPWRIIINAIIALILILILLNLVGVFGAGGPGWRIHLD